MDVSVLEIKDVVYEAKAKKVVLPAFDGEICVLDLHEPFLYRLRRGFIRVDDSFSLEIKDGMARMKDNRLVIMVKR